VVSVIRHSNGVECAPPICEFCGCEIDYPAKRCAALEDGRCRPWLKKPPQGPFTVPRLPWPFAAHRTDLPRVTPRRWSGVRDNTLVRVEPSAETTVGAASRPYTEEVV